jgi:Ca-activated chloride channel family protein
MHFLNPYMLLTLTAIPILILIHTLKPKPRKVEVTNLLFWQEALKERNSRMTFERLIKNLPLLLQILIVLLAALALAKPTWTYLSAQKGNLILVIDTSASMQTRFGSGSRFDLAKEKALELIEQRDPNQKIMIVEAGRQAMVKTGFMDSSSRAEDIVRKLAPSDAAAGLEPAVYLALSFVDPAAEDLVYLITDGADRDIAGLVKNHPKIRPIIVGSGGQNVGITKFEFRQQIDRNDQYEFMLEVKNFDLHPKACSIRLLLDNVILFDEPTEFEAREKKLLILPYAGVIGGIAKATLDIDDDFAVDNHAYLSLNTAKDIWVLLASPGNPFLEKLLAAYPNFHVNSVKEIMPSSWQEQTARHDIVIVDRLDFPQTQRGNFLLIDSYSPSIPVLKTGDIGLLRNPVWDRANPLMADVDLSGLIVAQSSRLEVDKRVTPVVTSDHTGLMYRFEAGGLRAVLLSFDITRSDLPFKVAFPVMMSNIFNWLNPHKLEFSILQTRAGEPFDIYLNPQTDIFYTRAPYEKWQKQQAAAGPFRYTGTRKVGIYTVSENNRQRYFTVNLADESESDIGPQSIDTVTDRSARSPLAPEIAVQRPLWSALILAVCGFLMAEWYLWLRLK